MPKMLCSLCFTDTSPVYFQAGKRQLYLWVLVQPLQNSISGILCRAVLCFWVWTFLFLDLEKKAPWPGFPKEKGLTWRVTRGPFLLVQAVLRSSTRLCYSKHTAEDTEDAEGMPWVPAAWFGEAEAGGRAGGPRGCWWASTGAEGRRWPQFAAMPGSSLASEDADDPFCQVAAALGDFRSGTLKIFTAIFYAGHRAPCILCWKRANVTRLQGLGSSSPTARMLCKAVAVALFCHVALGSHSVCFSPAASPTRHWQIRQSWVRSVGGLPDGSARLIIIFCYPSFVSFFFFLFFQCLPSLFSSFTFKSFFTSLFIPGSHRAPRYRGGIPRTLYVASVTAYGTSAASGSSERLCLAPFHVRPCACARCRLFSWPLKQGPRLMQFASTNTVKRGFWMADNLFSEQTVPCRQECYKL